MSKNVIVLSLLVVIFIMSFFLASNLQTAKAQSIDVVNFCLVFDNKQFKFSSSEFEMKFNTFDNIERASRYSRFGTKQEKLATIERAIKLGFGAKAGLNYIFYGLNEKIDKISKNLYRKAQDAEMKVKPKQKYPFDIKNEVVGVEVDEDALYEKMLNQYQRSNNVVVEIPTIKTMPKVFAENYIKQTCYRGGFSTNIASSSADRKSNIFRSLNSLNGKIIAPNEIFSFNKTIGRRTAENGYRTAKIIVDGEFVDGTGGGVCQTSTTLYNAVLLSKLEVLQVNKHSQRVSYVPPALDAMVNFGSSDLIFRNNTQSNVYIIANYTKEKIKISIYGEALPQGVSYQTKSEIKETLPAVNEKVIIDTEGKYCDKVMYKDESFVLKPGKEGVIAESYLETYKNGQLINSQLLRRDKYPPQDTVRVYGNRVRKNVEVHANAFV